MKICKMPKCPKNQENTIIIDFSSEIGLLSLTKRETKRTKNTFFECFPPFIDWVRAPPDVGRLP